jgi:hypothetical protein
MSSKLNLKEKTPEERKEFFEKIIQDNVHRLTHNPRDIYHINVSVYQQKLSRPDRLTVNVDFIFDRGTRYPFKTVANCVNRNRMREIQINGDSWEGYAQLKEQLTKYANGHAYAGKLRNRRSPKSALSPSRIIPKTVLILRPDINSGGLVVDLTIDTETYVIDLLPDTDVNSSKHFQLRGYYQKIEEEEW